MVFEPDVVGLFFSQKVSLVTVGSGIVIFLPVYIIIFTIIILTTGMCVLCLSLLSHSSLLPQACLCNVYDHHDHHHRCVCSNIIFMIIVTTGTYVKYLSLCSIYRHYHHRFGRAVYIIITVISIYTGMVLPCMS